MGPYILPSYLRRDIEKMDSVEFLSPLKGVWSVKCPYFYVHKHSF